MKRLFVLLLLMGLVSISTAAIVTDGLIIHLDASTLSLSDGDSVTSWADSATGDTIDGTVGQLTTSTDLQYPGQTVTYGTPTFVSNAINGYSAVHFTRPEGDNNLAPVEAKQVLVSQDYTWNASLGLTMFVVATGGTTGTNAQRTVQVGSRTGANFQNFAADLSSNLSGVRYGNGRALADSPFAKDEWIVTSFQMAQSGKYNTGLDYQVNGEVQTIVDKGIDRTIAFIDAGQVITLGGGFLQNATHSMGWLDWYDGSIAEVLVYNGQLTDAQIAQTNAYLMEKYAVPEPATLVLLGLGSLVAIRCRKA